MKTAKRTIAVFALLCAAAFAASAQGLPRLAILPFTGANGEDAEAIAEFFSFEPDITRNFTVVPRTSAIETIMKEQEFQRSGLTDSDTISELGKQMNADYVLAGHISSLGASNLLLITIIHVEELRQIAGDYREYKQIEETEAMLSEMAKHIAEASRRDTSRLARLAVLPFNVQSSGVNEADAEVLAQILATDIANSGKYAVFPRTKAIETVMREHHIERSGMTDPDNIRRIGEALNAQYVLSANFRSLGASKYFSAAILDIEHASQTGGSRKQYKAVADGLTLMAELAEELVTAAAQTARAVADNARALLEKAKALFDSEDYANAIPALSEAIALDNGFAEAWAYRARARAGIKEYDAAMTDANRALQLDPRLAYAYYARGYTHAGKGDHDRAIADYSEAIRLNPGDALSYNNRGVGYFDKGDYDRAIADSNEAIRLKPDADTYYLRGLAYYSKGEYDRAIADSNEAIRLKPGYAEAYFMLGAVYSEIKRDYNRAIADSTEAIRLKPDFAEAYFIRGWSYHNKGEYDRAIADYTEAIRLKPDFADAYNNRGIAYHNNKRDYDRAIADYEAALRINPNHPRAKTNLENVRKAKAGNR